MKISKSEISREAIRVRKLIESCDPENTAMVISDFPIMSCKLSSLILVYHFLQLYPKVEIKGIGGVRPDSNLISHYWIEIEGFAVDITGDQYNLIDDDELDEVLIARRPFCPIHVVELDNSFLYDTFDVSYVDIFTTEILANASESFIERLVLSYSQLIAIEKHTEQTV